MIYYAPVTVEKEKIMEMKLNASVFNAETLREKGMNASQVATKLGVSRECVSKWLKGESMPKPDKLLALGMLLGLAYSQLVVRFGDAAAPIVHFRKKQNRVQDDEDKESTSSIADFVKHIAKYSPAGEGITIAPLKNPKSDYDYAAMAAGFFRQQLNLPRKIESKHLVHWFKLFGINLIPAFWGGDEYYGNALRICLPGNSTWVVLNLDSKVSDFLFWMAHEIGHSIAPSLDGDEAEAFADHFAQALLFPPSEADALYAKLPSAKSAVVGAILSAAKDWNVSPYTICKSLEWAEKRSEVAKTKLPDIKTVMGAANRKVSEKTVAEIVFGGKDPTPDQFVSKSEQWLKTSFFRALAAYLTHGAGENPPIGSIAHLLGLSPDDSYGVIKHLAERA